MGLGGTNVNGEKSEGEYGKVEVKKKVPCSGKR